MNFLKLLFGKWEPQKGVWYRNKKKTTLIVDPPNFQGQPLHVIGKEVRYTNCYIIRDGQRRRGSFKVIGSKVRFIEGWKYKRYRVKTVDYKDCIFSKSIFFGPWTYTLRIIKNSKIENSPQEKSVRIRKKGVALVEKSNSFLVVKGHKGSFTLPGGGANKGESRKSAAIRELKEETGLVGLSAKFLFEYSGKRWHDHRGKEVTNQAKVFLIKTMGKERPRHEIKKVAWWNPNNNKIKVSKRTEWIIKKYLQEKSKL